MAKKRILVLGGGISGLSAAWHLQKKSRECVVFEKENQPGGLCRSKKINGWTFDFSGHLLHFKHRYAFGLVKDLLGHNLSRHTRQAWIYSCGRYTRYPFQANLHGLPADIVKECLLGFINASSSGCAADRAEGSFLDWIQRTFGSGIARHFMVPYNTKFWTLEPSEMTCEWLDGFIPVPSLSQLMDGTLKESRRQFGYNSHFWYPKTGGIRELPLALSGRLKNVHTNCRVSEINLKKKRIRLASGSSEGFDYLISTIPLPEMSRIIKDLPGSISASFRKLSWNSIFNLNLGVGSVKGSGRHWVYFPQKELSFFRVGFPSNISASLAPEEMGSLYAEVSYSKDKPLDKSNIISRLQDDLIKAGVINHKDPVIVQDVNDIKYGYPIYDRNYRQARREILDYLISKDIFPCGRYGSWRYMSMEDCLLDGRSAAEEALKN